MHEAVAYIHDHADTLRGQHAPCDELGQLTATTVDVLRQSGGMQLLQANSHGGFQSSPHDFFEWARTVAHYNPSAGWVAGVVGVHPWEVALLDPQLQDEIYGGDPTRWVASPYAPQGRATREGDGFRFSGQWQYSTGTDHCDWIVLGGLVIDPEGGPPEMRHFFLPRGDYEIVEDSWHVMGLSGTGSKDIRVTEAFVPEYRTAVHGTLAEGGYAARRAHAALYHIPFGCMFSAAIASATFGIASSAIDRYREVLPSRVSMGGIVGKTDPFQQAALAEVEADLAAGISHVDAMIAEWLTQLAAGQPVTKGQRLTFRRNQVRAVQRVLFGVDKLFASAGAASVWTNRPLERHWRDLRTAGAHISNTADAIYLAATSYSLGDEDAGVAMY